MKTNNTMRGLITLTFFRTRNTVLGGIVYMIIMGIAFLASDQIFLHGMFMFTAVVYLPIQMIVGMAADDGRWERFQIALPIKRTDLLKAQYLSVVLVSLIGFVVLTAGIGAGTVISEEYFNNGFASNILSSLHIYGMAFLSIGLLFILAMFVPPMVAWIISGLTPAIVMTATPTIGENLGISAYIASGAVLAVSVIVFVVSYLVSKVSYQRSDF